MGQPDKNCLHGEKSSHLSEISPVLRWDLSWVVWIHSHMNDFLLQSEIHHSAEISLKWDVSPGWDDYSHVNSSWLILNYLVLCVLKAILSHYTSSYSRTLMVEKNCFLQNIWFLIPILKAHCFYIFWRKTNLTCFNSKSNVQGHINSLW